MESLLMGEDKALRLLGYHACRHDGFGDRLKVRVTSVG